MHLANPLYLLLTLRRLRLGLGTLNLTLTGQQLRKANDNAAWRTANVSLLSDVYMSTWLYCRQLFRNQHQLIFLLQKCRSLTQLLQNSGEQFEAASDRRVGCNANSFIDDVINQRPKRLHVCIWASDYIYRPKLFRTLITVTSCAGGRHDMPPPPAPWKLIFDLLTLKVVSESRVTWATSVPILVFLGLFVLDLGPIYATDQQ